MSTLTLNMGVHTLANHKNPVFSADILRSKIKTAMNHRRTATIALSVDDESKLVLKYNVKVEPKGKSAYQYNVVFDIVEVNIESDISIVTYNLSEERSRILIAYMTNYAQVSIKEVENWAVRLPSLRLSSSFDVNAVLAILQA